MNTEPSSVPVLSVHRRLVVRQIFEVAEFFGFETRNKYEIMDEQGSPVAYAAEQQKGILNFLFRQWLGHWRTYDVMFFNSARASFFRAHHPFRWFFHRFEIFDETGAFIGALQQRFSIFSKRFDVEDRTAMAVMQVNSPIWKLWTFTFEAHGRARAGVSKRWSGVLTEMFTDKDTFMVDFTDPGLNENERKLVLAAAVFIDMKYFEAKAD